MLVKNGNLPQGSGWKQKNLWNHHLDYDVIVEMAFKDVYTIHLGNSYMTWCHNSYAEQPCTQRFPLLQLDDVFQPVWQKLCQEAHFLACKKSIQFKLKMQFSRDVPWNWTWYWSCILLEARTCFFRTEQNPGKNFCLKYRTVVVWTFIVCRHTDSFGAFIVPDSPKRPTLNSSYKICRNLPPCFAESQGMHSLNSSPYALPATKHCWNCTIHDRWLWP